MPNDDELSGSVSPLSFFSQVYEGFLEAQTHSGEAPEFSFRIGGFPVSLRFANQALVSRMVPALQHLHQDVAGDPALTICLWDSLSTGVDMPPPPWSPEDLLPRGDVRNFSDQRIRTYYQLGADALSLLDVERHVGIYWVRDAAEVPYYESAAPLRALLGAWMETRGKLLVHGAAVGDERGGVLLAAKGGSGKSTAALACLHSELGFLGDDYCLISPDPVPTVYSLYCVAKKDAGDIQRLPDLLPSIKNAPHLETEKAVYSVFEHFPDKLIEKLPLHAILIPGISNQPDTSIQPVSPAAALKALAPTTLFQLPGSGQRAFLAMAGIIRGIPCYRLSLGTDLRQIPGTIASLLSELAVSQ